MANVTAILPDDRQAAALRRIGYYGRDGKRIDVWNVLQWLINFSQRNLAACTPGDIEVLREDYRALQEVALPGMSLNEGAESLSVEKLALVQRMLDKHVKELAETARSDFGPFETTISVLFPRLLKDAEKLQQPIRFWMISGERVSPFDGKGLLYLMARLLQQVKLAVLKCPTCTTIFLQPRKDARFCSSTCRALHHASKRRTGRRRGRPKKQISTQHKKGGRRHGKKKRTR